MVKALLLGTVVKERGVAPSKEGVVHPGDRPSVLHTLSAGLVLYPGRRPSLGTAPAGGNSGRTRTVRSLGGSVLASETLSLPPGWTDHRGAVWSLWLPEGRGRPLLC